MEQGEQLIFSNAITRSNTHHHHHNPHRHLKGGAYTLFHWRTLITGSKLSRVQYPDELEIPPAEINFSSLISFLLDRGAVPDPQGFEDVEG